MYKHYLVVTQLFLLLFSIANAQDSRISGKLIEEKTLLLIPFSTLSLHRAIDSALVITTVTDSLGNFFFSNVDQGRYIIRISIMGYSKKHLEIDVKADLLTLDLGNILVLCKKQIRASGKQEYSLPTMVNRFQEVSASCFYQRIPDSRNIRDAAKYLYHCVMSASPLT